MRLKWGSLGRCPHLGAPMILCPFVVIPGERKNTPPPYPPEHLRTHLRHIARTASFRRDSLGKPCLGSLRTLCNCDLWQQGAVRDSKGLSCRHNITERDLKILNRKSLRKAPPLTPNPEGPETRNPKKPSPNPNPQSFKP